MSAQQLPVVVIGAGPIGLAAAAHLTERGLTPLVLEAGPAAATAVRTWSHIRLFSLWGEVIDPAAEKLLAPTGWTRPDADGYPSGADWAERYLQPLADALGERVRYGATVTGVSRAGRDRIVDADRASQPFTVHVAHADGREERILARAVLDASGTWTTPSPAGGSGLPALGERAAADRIELTLPETGVCGGSGLYDAPEAAEADGGGCCAAPEPQLVQLGVGAPAATPTQEAPASGCCGA